MWVFSFKLGKDVIVSGVLVTVVRAFCYFFKFLFS
jgi:hypothetical protein